MSVLTERLGYPPDAKLLIVHCDDLGMSDAANAGVEASLRRGAATSASLMVPCGRAEEAARHCRDLDLGVHLTLNAEWDGQRWGPLTRAPSLVDGDGGFPPLLEAVWERADLDEVRRECQAQVERALSWGVDVTHLDAHMHVMQHPAGLVDAYLEVAAGFGLPVRLTGSRTGPSAAAGFRERAARAGVVFPDNVVHLHQMGTRGVVERALHELPPGVTEVYAHPAADTPELRALAADWAGRVDDLDLLTDGRTIPRLAERAGAVLIGYRPLRAAMRA